MAAAAEEGCGGAREEWGVPRELPIRGRDYWVGGFRAELFVRDDGEGVEEEGGLECVLRGRWNPTDLKSTSIITA